VHAYLRAELDVPESTLARLRETMLE
jgi:hypothetical protein